MIAQEELKNFYGTENYHQILSYTKDKLYLTDGVNYIMENGGQGGAAWLFTAIGSYQPKLQKNPMARDFQNWKLKTNLQEKTAVLTCDDGNGNILVRQSIGYTDFDMEEISFYVERGDRDVMVIMLPSER